VEEVFGVIEPAREHVGVERQLLLGEFGAPIGAGDLVDRGLDAELGEALLHQHAERLVDAGKIQVERDRGLETVGVTGLGEQRLDRKSTRLNSSHLVISYAVFCLKKKK